MNIKRFFAFILILMMTMTMFAGCKTSKNDEQAVAGDYVEGEEYTQSGDKPEKGEDSEIIENEDPKGDSEQEQKPSNKEEQTPSDKEEQTPSDKEEQTPSDKEEQKPSDQEDEKEEQKPSDQEDEKEEQKPSDQEDEKEEQKPNNNQQTPSQDEEDEEDPFPDEDDPSFDDDDEDFIDEDEDGEPDEDDTPSGNPSGKPSGGTPVQKPNQDEQDVLFANTLKIVAYNVRMKNDGNGNDIADRQPRFKAMVEEYQPDIMGLSEANEPWIKYLESNIVGSKYQMIYTYRAPNSKEAQPILFDKSKFELLDDGYFWLSETPDEASKGWGGEYYRGATWAKLRVRDTGKTFLYYSTHLTGSDNIAVPSAKVIYNHAVDQRGFSTYPVFVSGDFNFKTDSAGYKEITKHFVDVNNYLGFDSTITFVNNYDPAQGGKLIDYVMCSPDNVTPKKYQVIQKKYLGGYVSDHRGLYVEAFLK